MTELQWHEMIFKHSTNTLCHAAAVDLQMDTRADAPSWGRTLASAGRVIHAGNHRGMPCVTNLSGLHYGHKNNRCSRISYLLHEPCHGASTAAAFSGINVTLDINYHCHLKA